MKESFSPFLDLSYFMKDDDYNWQLMTTESSLYYIHPEKLRSIRRISRYLYLTNPHYRGLIRTYIKYIAGKGVDVIGSSDRQRKFWKMFCELRNWDNLFREIISSFFQDGEVFVLYKNYKLVDPDCIVSSGKTNDLLGISVNPKTKEVEYYSYLNDGVLYKVYPKDMLHIKDTDIRFARGVPYLLPVMKNIKDYEKWLKDRITLNQIRSSIVMIRKHQAQPTTVKSFVDSQNVSSGYQQNTSGTSNSRMFEPGTIIDTTASTDYQFLSPNIGANDVTEDGRALRLTLSSCTGLPEFMTSGDSSNGNYASSVVAESPAIREFENWQNFFTEYIVIIWRNVMDRYNIKYEKTERPKIMFQPLTDRDKLKNTQINEILFKNNIITQEEWRSRENLLF